ncbi:MAG TPA: universal stress protein [Terriglobia bacterium]|nr:universal stress protein [Terriglobia bacterium]
MTEPATEFVVRRILVALDASAQSLAALHAAVILAAGLGADLEGLFVEDINLMRMAMLPVARRVLYPSAAEETLDSSRMEREMRVLARQAQESLATMAERSGIRWSFRVVRGKVTVEILSAASESDLLTVGKSGWSLARKMQLGSTAHNAAVHAPKALLLVKRPLAANRPVIALYDGSVHAEQALKAAAKFARAFQGRLIVFLLADDQQQLAALKRAAGPLIKATEIQARFRPVIGPAAQRLADAIESEAGGLLVLSRQYKDLSEQDVQDLLRAVGNPVLLVR